MELIEMYPLAEVREVGGVGMGAPNSNYKQAISRQACLNPLKSQLMWLTHQLSFPWQRDERGGN